MDYYLCGFIANCFYVVWGMCYARKEKSFNANPVDPGFKVIPSTTRRRQQNVGTESQNMYHLLCNYDLLQMCKMKTVIKRRKSFPKQDMSVCALQDR